MRKNKNAFFIAEVLFNLQLPMHVIKEISGLAEEELQFLKPTVSFEEK
ncbi:MULTISPECIES: hypothetical protein [Bacillus]|nr:MULTISPECIES: hypothetical protein [Bacillus]